VVVEKENRWMIQNSLVFSERMDDKKFLFVNVEEKPILVFPPLTKYFLRQIYP
jgi:hypothetical protein